MSEKKICARCKIAKNKSNFHKCTPKPDGLQRLCRACSKLYKREYYANYKLKHGHSQRNIWRHKHPERDHNNWLKWKYGITLEDKNRLWEIQGRCCAICKTKNNNGRKFHVDHSHETGNVRGLLCHKCNIMLGGARDDIAILRFAVRYLSGEAQKGEVSS